MEKRKSLLDEESMKRKLSKLSPRDRAKVERNIIESEKVGEKYRRKEEALMRLPKEKRLKAICSRYIELSVYFAKIFGSMKEATAGDIKELKRELKFELTMALKKAGVLPLEG